MMLSEKTGIKADTDFNDIQKYIDKAAIERQAAKIPTQQEELANRAILRYIYSIRQPIPQKAQSGAGHFVWLHFGFVTNGQ